MMNSRRKAVWFVSGTTLQGWIHGFYQYAEAETQGVVVVFEEAETGVVRTLDPAHEGFRFEEW